MDTKEISILLMDDEPSSPIIRNTMERFKDEGFTVDIVETMSDAVQAYYEKFYDVFILDIDMSLIPDDQEGDGVNVLKRFISLHNKTRVIMFSAAGKVHEWFESVNMHCFAYVHKNEEKPIDHLIELIRSAQKPEEIDLSSKNKCPQEVFLCCIDESYQEKAKETVTAALGADWDIKLFSTLEDVDTTLQADGIHGIVVILKDNFSLRSGEKSILTSILSRSPAPPVIIGCQGKDKFRYSILFIANNHPFRMVNTEDAAWPEHLAEALNSAKSWYGKREIFKADADALKRMHITLPPDAISEWENYDAEDMDELYEDLYDDSEKGIE